MSGTYDRSKIKVTSKAFTDGYEVGCEHPAFLIGNTLEEAPESDHLNPYEKGTDEYLNWRIGFNSAIL